MIQTIKNWFYGKPMKPVSISKLEKVYTDKEGRNWYMYKNPLDMPKIRFAKLCEAERYSEMKITKAQLDTILDKMIELGNQGKLVELSGLVMELKERNKLIAELESLLMVISIVYIVEGEDSSIYDPVATHEKYKMLANDYQAQSFFLSMYQTLYLRWEKSLSADMVNYLRTTAGTQKYLNRHGKTL
jgi:hypothetical protein